MITVAAFMSDLGKKVRFLRKQAKLTQVQLADLAGVGKSTVFDLEKGCTTLRIDSILPILAVLNVDIRLSGPLDSEAGKASVEGNERHMRTGKAAPPSDRPESEG